jgi:hypothetical protein
MLNSALAHLNTSSDRPASLTDRLQVALAIADESVLKPLLANCEPRISPLQAVGAIRAAVGLPISGSAPACGVITFDRIACVLAQSPAELEHHVNPEGDRDRLPRQFERLTRCETETQTLGHGISLAQALSLLAYAGFSPQQIETILTLPYEAFHKSWWYTLDAEGHVAMPFHRTLRTRQLADGTFILHYKDHFAQDRPPCFHSQPVSVLIELQAADEGFGATIARLNLERQALGVQHTLLIGDRPSEYEMRGYISQGISLITAHEVSLPAEAHCQICGSYDCPLQGRNDSPVHTCYRFYPAP